MNPDLVDRLQAALSAGPLTGEDLMREAGGDRLDLWRACHLTDGFVVRSVAEHYVRLDESLDGYARLSPSILREFMTYTVIALDGQLPRLAEAVDALNQQRLAISAEKRQITSTIIDTALARTGIDAEESGFGFFIAGDVVYGMAHDRPRESISSPDLVKGSDLDVVIVHRDDTDGAQCEALSRELLRLKSWALGTAGGREELDFVLKSASEAAAQIFGDTFRDFVASKILDEALFLAGDSTLEAQLRETITGSPWSDRLRGFVDFATTNRAEAIERLLADRAEPGDLTLFHPTEELFGIDCF